MLLQLAQVVKPIVNIPLRILPQLRIPTRHFGVA